VFTGIVERSLPVLDVSRTSTGIRIVLPNPWSDVKHGESVAVNGTCLTVTEISEADGAKTLAFDAIPETLSRTNLGLLKAGDEVHVERSLRLGDRFDGHMVQGHVDGTARILSQTKTADWRVCIELPADLARFFVAKGSVTLDGVSLTIAALSEESFEVALIPTTLDITRLGKRPIGWPLNVECDMMAKTVVRFLELRGDLK
jgi:riboflavin synthase